MTRQGGYYQKHGHRSINPPSKRHPTTPINLPIQPHAPHPQNKDPTTHLVAPTHAASPAQTTGHANRLSTFMTTRRGLSHSGP
ncbi:hypothetical protein EJ03DRAFT_330947 [Teratosphaeria nubilosa]|uniref:Uncharacterized protein n=1 Tax=Teratosphaeria nubilosa TaxID=161662 RepID=A0A6G1KZQ7_9PEZI|nr:hypothetical protein EJ03DRAFT_330947 [Teratosphaeria nubilosa]